MHRQEPLLLIVDKSPQSEAWKRDFSEANSLQIEEMQSLVEIESVFAEAKGACLLHRKFLPWFLIGPFLGA